MKCPKCQEDIPGGGSSCSACGFSFDSATQMLEPSGEARVAPSIHSTESSDGGSFRPGEILAERYRMVSLLGRGGMGEVYRADDLKLGQPVALKFLPEHLTSDGAALARFHREVRVARQVSHRNVCRVYDIGEIDGRHFLSMEFIKGEELSSLLHRIGRLPNDKAIQLARQICAGLAAAHETGILHRDLKPANVMIDENGNARITDFGLAGLAEEFKADEIGAGTPAYMSPEQIEGGELTIKSDIYSLGLVLYELFTGKQAFVAATVGELIDLRRSNTSPTTPTSIVKGFDPVIEKLIDRCIQKDPSTRPSSALQVAAALPGGDPMAAALAAGETPSPEMVAASGEKTGLRPAIAMALLAAIIVGLGLVALMGEKAGWKSQLLRQSSPETMKGKAQEMIRRLGYAERPVDSASGYQLNGSFIDWAAVNTAQTDRWSEFTASQPAPVWFWYRQSPRYLEADRIASFSKVTWTDPSSTSASGMVGVVMDPAGRLTWLIAVPPQIDPQNGETPPKADWAPLFTAAGLDQAAFTSTASTWTPPVTADERSAWTGTYPGQPDVPIRIEAAAYRGILVHFAVITPWTRPWLIQPQPVTTGQTVANVILTTLLFIVLIGAWVLARKSLRQGRGDRRGAARLALFIFAMIILNWIFGADHAPTANALGGFMTVAVSQALLGSGIVWLMYIGLEPYVRRRLPETIISWNRVLAGNVSDPLVARDVLIGILIGTAFMLFPSIGEVLRLGAGIPPSNYAALDSWLSASQFARAVFGSMSGAVLASLGYLFLIFLMYVITRRRWLAGLVIVLVLTIPAAVNSDGPIITAVMVALYWLLLLVAYFRVGLLAVAVGNLVLYLLNQMPMGIDLTAWHSNYMIAALVGFIGVAAWAFHTSLGGQKLFKGSLLED